MDTFIELDIIKLDNTIDRNARRIITTMINIPDGMLFDRTAFQTLLDQYFTSLGCRSNIKFMDLFIPSNNGQHRPWKQFNSMYEPPGLFEKINTDVLNVRSQTITNAISEIANLKQLSIVHPQHWPLKTIFPRVPETNLAVYCWMHNKEPLDITVPIPTVKKLLCLVQ